MKLVKFERPKGYTGPIFDCPNQETVSELGRNFVPRKELERAYEAWAADFFSRNPRGTLSHNGFESDRLVVRGTGDNGRWLVAWSFEMSDAV
jgi:hypothetical protein